MLHSLFGGAPPKTIVAGKKGKGKGQKQEKRTKHDGDDERVELLNRVLFRACARKDNAEVVRLKAREA